MNANFNTKKKKKKIIASLILKKKKLYFVLVLSLLVDDCILMYLKITNFVYLYFFNTIWMSI